MRKSKVFKGHKVFCDGCSFLLYIPEMGSPLCVAGCLFKDGPLRKRIDLIGMSNAEKENAHNDCLRRRGVSKRAWEIKRWILWRMNDGTSKEVKPAKLSEYSVQAEHKGKVKYNGKDHGAIWVETDNFERPDPGPEETFPEDYFEDHSEEEIGEGYGLGIIEEEDAPKGT